MRLPLLMASIGTAVLLLTACGGEPETPETNNAPQPAPPPAPSPKPKAPEPGAAQPFENPVVPGAPKDPTSIANLGLLIPSDPEEERKKVTQGKENPFEIFNVEPAPSDPRRTGAKIPALDPRQVPAVPKLPEEIGPNIEENIDVAVRLLPTLEARQIPSVPDLPPISPYVSDGEPLSIPTRVTSRPQIPPPPPQEARQVPDIAGLPGEFGPPKRGPSLVPAPPPQQPRQVPDVPGLPPDFGPSRKRQSPVPPPPPQETRQVPDVPGLPADFGPALPSPGDADGGPSGQGYRPGRRPGQAPGQAPGQSPGQGFGPGPISQDGQSPGQGFSPDPISQDGQTPGQSFGPGEAPPGDGIPLPLSTELAQNVEVSGIIQVGRDIQIIVKAPNEQTTRYVRVGQKIANGEVLVKRVEQLKESDPVVILEQNGIEVRKVVGEKPITESS